MTKPRPAYDSEGARILERYFKRNIAPHLTNGKGDRDTRACTTYLLLVFLEQEQGGLCRPITVDTKTAADRFYVARATLGRTLRVLAACDAIEFLSGQSVLRNAKATQIRRRTVKELEGGEFRAELRPHTPADASEICRVLGGRSFCYNGEQISPRFSAESTGRIYTSSPSPQLDDGKARLKKALTGAKPGQWILEVDYRQADPTVVKTILNDRDCFPAKRWPHDVYQHLADLRGEPRNAVKDMGNILFYCANSTAYLKSLCVHAPKGSFLADLAEALDTFKKEMWKHHRPQGRRPAKVNTLGGTQVEGVNAGRGRRQIHLGTLMAWLCQGSVADALNAATLELIRQEASRKWTVLSFSDT